MPELVLYGIKLLTKQFLGTVLDIEVDQSELHDLTDNIQCLPLLFTLIYVYLSSGYLNIAALLPELAVAEDAVVREGPCLPVSSLKEER